MSGLERGHGSHRTFLVLGIAGVCAATTFLIFLHAHTDSIQRSSVVQAAIMSIVWSAPILVLLRCTGRWLVMIGGAAYVAAAVVMLRITYGSTHSTAGIGLVVWPVCLVFGVVSFVAATSFLQRQLAK